MLRGRKYKLNTCVFWITSFIYTHYLIFEGVWGEEQPSGLGMHFGALWIRVYGLPLKLLYEAMVKQFGEIVGMFEEVHENQSWSRFAYTTQARHIDQVPREAPKCVFYVGKTPHFMLCVREACEEMGEGCVQIWRGLDKVWEMWRGYLKGLVTISR